MNETGKLNLTEKMDAPPVQKEWANPTPAGLVALAVACFCYFAILGGFVEKSAMPLMGCWLIGGFVVQLVVGLVDLKGGSTSGGNTFLFFCAYFMLVGGLGMFVKNNSIVSELLLDTRIDGFAWIALMIALFLWTPAFLKTFNLLSLVVLFIDAALPFIVLMDLKVIPATPIPAYLLLVSGLFALYLSAAQVVNTTYGRKIYPVIEKKK